MGNNISERRNDGGDDMRRIVELTVSIATLASAAYFLYTINDALSQFAEKEANFDREKKELARKLKRPEIEHLQFSKHEISIALDVVCPDDLKTSFSDVGGMEQEIEKIMDNVILPFKFWKEENSLLKHPANETHSTTKGYDTIACHVPGGMLLYGRPGTGKSMLAKAIAKEAEASFIGVKSGTILDKYVGESDKLIGAIFSLAQKIAPTVIFIDEVDTLLKKRESLQSGASNCMSSMLGTLMSEWDGLNSDGKAPVIVLGATNRPMDIDMAFRRRMPLTIQTKEPDFYSRVDILTKLLKSEAVSPDVNIEVIASSTEGFTGSDLREICRLASISRMKAIMLGKKDGSYADHIQRPLIQADFDHAIAMCIREGDKQHDYTSELASNETRDRIDIATSWIRAALARNSQNSNPAPGNS